MSCGAQRTTMRVTSPGSIRIVSFQPVSSGRGGRAGPWRKDENARFPPTAPSALGVLYGSGGP
jgi:hypothetical protein